ncbi:MAG: DNA-3-methyladenine glycosylase I [Pseudomonadota bacterium]
MSVHSSSGDIVRCQWVTDDPLYIEYHDTEWGVPTRDSLELFEMLCLEGMQAGLSWITVLKKRAHYRTVCDGLDPSIMSGYDQTKIDALLQDPGIIRNRLKVHALVNNASCYLSISQRCDFSAYLWQFVNGAPSINHWTCHSEVPSTSSESDAMSAALKSEGFKFVGSTICYAFMQASGMVNDHTLDCVCRQTSMVNNLNK